MGCNTSPLPRRCCVAREPWPWDRTKVAKEVIAVAVINGSQGLSGARERKRVSKLAFASRGLDGRAYD
jgi:hypothetical protein